MQVLEDHSYQGRLPGCTGAICSTGGGIVGKHSNIIKELFVNFCMYIGSIDGAEFMGTGQSKLFKFKSNN